MTENRSPAESLQLIGGSSAVDFVNTVGDRKSDSTHNYLASYADLVAWCRHAGILDGRDAEGLLKEAARHGAKTEQVYRRALILREALYHILCAAVNGLKPSSSDLLTLNEMLAEALSHARVGPAENGYIWYWQDEENRLAQMLYPIARSAADLLTSGDLGRLRECQDVDCGWLFVDTSKNHSRRWCSMGDCGNRAKARRHYKRVKSR